ncbi:hypothetical protein [Pontibacter fetidus]|uniref:Oligosaccharide repeat unit polymerase n=1 Tax=Pontibacter fetidus TaxID=2700082 RepID=A0A6B2GUE3_9BACT|nr:hypothetical protein [Pontibacter fetidus]NDK54519.1 hypothetical protein [Pontibacter fetidus]
MKNSYILILAIIILFYSLLYGFNEPDNLCILISILSLLNFLTELGKTIAIRSLTLLIATIQWILGPYLSYNFLDSFDYYFMPVPQKDYFALAIPGILLFAIGLYTIKDHYLNENRIFLNLKAYLKDKHSLGLYLIFFGVILTYIGPLFPTALAFFFYLLANLKYIGAFYLLFSERRDKFIYIGGVLIILVLDAFAFTMFHDLLLWLGFLFLLFALSYRPSVLTKFLIVCMGGLLAFGLQAIKGDYRNAVWGGLVTEDITKVDVLESSFSKRISEQGLFSERNNKHFIYRINQGWIVGHTMLHTPSKEPFANGETITNGLVATLLPRFIAADKATSGGREYFEKYTGLLLVKGTSMDLSPLGEAYANFATIGGAIFMFILGLFYALVLSLISKWSIATPSLILWIPLIFQQAIKAESDITTGLNHITKASLVVFLVYWISNKIFNTKL